MAKQKNIDYILGMIARASLMIAPWAAGNTIKDVKVVNQYMWIL